MTESTTTTTPSAEATNATETVTSPLDHVDAFIPRVMAAMQVPGMSVSVHRDGKPLLHKAYGVRTYALPLDDPANELKTSSMFDLCSVTKHFTSAAIGVLVHQGKLNWTDKVTQHLPEFALPDELATRECTITDILSHRSGIEGGDLLWFGSTRNGNAAYKLLDAIPQMKMAGRFRDAYYYSNNMYSVATVLVERVSGVAYPDFVTEHLLDPLGITAIWCSDEAREHPEVAQPHDSDDLFVSLPTFLDRHVWNKEIDFEALKAMDPPTTVDEGLERAAAVRRHVVPIRSFSEDNRDSAGAGFLFTSTDDMAKWTACLLNGGKSPSGQQVIYDLDVLTKVHNPVLYSSTPTAPGSTMRVLGYGLGLKMFQHGEYEVIAHTGGMPGYAIYMFVIPGANLSMYIAQHQSHCSVAPGLVSLILEALLPLHRPDAAHATLLSVASNLAKSKLGPLPYMVPEMAQMFGTAPPAATATQLLPQGVAIEDLAGVYKHPAFGYVTIVLDDLATSPLAPRLRYISAPGTMKDMYLPLVARESKSKGEVQCVLWPDTTAVFRPSQQQQEVEPMKAAPAAMRVTGRAWTPRVRYELALGDDVSSAPVYVRVD
ncbi:beta-lactamase/transpeptidase-like protein [Blastocladiella britannica]|nr:beta-lactamase/transpeptidase-like protein [Blastocladiella britannica]